MYLMVISATLPVIVSDRIEKTTTVEKKTMEIEERGVKLRLTIVDTPGFGDAINCEDSWRVCSAYIDEQFRQYFTDESGLNRRHMLDNRVHCCLYFVPPWAHRYVDFFFCNIFSYCSVTNRSDDRYLHVLCSIRTYRNCFLRCFDLLLVHLTC